MILYVKQDGEWVGVPGIKGTSVYLTTLPTRIPADTSSSNPHNAGWQWVLFDERTGTTTTMEVYDGTNGADGSGSGTVTSIDGIAPPTGSGAVALQAVRYATQSLSTEAKTIARNNIDAMKNVTGASNGQVLTYNTSSSSWTAATPQSIVLPTASAQVLYSTSSSAYAWTSFNTISTAQINNLVT